MGFAMALVIAVVGLLIVTSIIDKIFGTTVVSKSPIELRASQEAEKKAAAKKEAAASQGSDEFKVRILAERHLKEVLRDPDSADIRATRVPEGRAFMCGEVNSNNGFGGKTGYRRFIAGGLSEMPVIIEGEGVSSTTFSETWNRTCA